MLRKIVRSIRENPNILEKKDITPFISYIQEYSFKSNRIFSDIGEDSASIINGDKLILITTDRIRTEFVANFPFGAGFSSILVGADDIYCCGGKPLAASLIVSFKEQSKGKKIIEGICEGSKKFKIPIIRGHTTPNGNYYELSSTIIGEINKEDYISAKGAKINDIIILAVDFDGKIGKASKFYWDTITFKTSKEVLKKRESMQIIAKRHLAHSAKDISNGGIFGTIFQLIKYSNLGADISINKIRIPPILIQNNYDLETYIKMYLTTSYILTAPETNCNKIIKIFNKYGLKAMVIGKIIKEPRLLKINDDVTSINVMKF